MRNSSKHITVLSDIIVAMFAMYCLYVFFVQAKLGINTLEFGDETEKFVAAQLINEGGRLYRDIFGHHGPLTFIIAHLYSVFVSPSNFTYIRWVMVGLVLLSCLSIFTSPIFSNVRQKVVSTSIFLYLLSVCWLLQSLHMVMYHSIGGLLFTVILSQLYMPCLFNKKPRLVGVICAGYCIALICFSAYSFGFSVLLILAATLLAGRNNIFAKSDLLRITYLLSIGVILGTITILLWLFYFGDIKGFFVYHFYFNQKIYAQFINFSLSNLLNLFTISATPSLIIHSSILAMLICSLIILFKSMWHGISRFGWTWLASLIFFSVSVFFLSPRGGAGFQAAAFNITSFAIVSMLLAHNLTRDDDIPYSISNGAFIILICYIFNVIGYEAISSPHGIKKVAMKQHTVVLKPYRSQNFLTALSRDKGKDSIKILSLIFNPSIYITTGLLPSSGRYYYYLPWQAAYDKSPLWGYKINFCEDLAKNSPSAIFFDDWKVWDRYQLADYDSCAYHFIKNNYTQIDGSTLYIKKNLLLERTIENTAENKISASLPLSKQTPLVIHPQAFPKRDNVGLDKLGILFGTHMRVNEGEAELILIQSDGEKHKQKFQLSTLADNHYMYFDVNGIRDIQTAEIRVFSGNGGVSVWENAGKTCLHYLFTDGTIQLTPGCPNL